VRTFRRIFGWVLSVMFALSAGAVSAQVLPESYTTLARDLDGRIGFETLPQRPEPGFNLDAPMRFHGAWLGELKEAEYQVRELVVDTKVSAMSGLLAECARRAKRGKADHLRFAMSHDHPFAKYCREHGAELTVSYPRNGGCMVRILDLPTTLTKLLPELNARLVRAGKQEYPAALTLSTDLGSVTLKTAADQVFLADSAEKKAVRVRMDQGRLAQLLCGYRGIDDLAALPDVSCPAKARPLLRALFPEGRPFIWGGDRF